MPGEKSFSSPEMDLAFKGRFFPPGRTGDNRAPGINNSRNACIGDANKIPPVFDGPHRAEIEVISIARRIFPPPVVGDHADKARFCGQVTGAVGAEDGFKADDRHNRNRAVRRYKGRTFLTITVGAAVAAKRQGVFAQKTQILNKGHALE